MTRQKAAFIHLLISSIALTLLTLMTIFIWYPPPYYRYEGVLQILQLLVLVDVVLGPVITFIVFKQGKPGLKFDLSIIATIQIAAFLYGTYTIYSQFPAYLLYANGQFLTVPISSIDQEKLPDPQLKRSWEIGPKLVMAKVPEDTKSQLAFTVAQITEGKTIADYPEYYQAYAPDLEQLADQKLDVESLMAVTGNPEVIEPFLRQRQLLASDFYLLKFSGKSKLGVIVLNRNDGMPSGFLDIIPN